VIGKAEEEAACEALGIPKANILWLGYDDGEQRLFYYTGGPGEATVKLPLPEKFPKPTRVHAHQGEPCPNCETVLEAVFFEDYVMSYCPECQTGGRVLKDRRLSRLLK
jgi:LmbE family N-acetylglucosaminyl deacetylase